MDSMGKMKSSWDKYIEALPKLESRNMFTPLRPMNIPIAGEGEGEVQTKFDEDEYETYDEIQPWDRLASQIETILMVDLNLTMPPLLTVVNSLIDLEELNYLCINTVTCLISMHSKQTVKIRGKVVVTDSMDGDISPMAELAQLRKKHGFLWVLDDAHGTFVWGKNGGGLAEEFNCYKIWKQWIQSRGRSFIVSTIAPVPLAAASYASVVVAKKETWRRREIQNRMKELHALTGIPVKSQIVCVIIGDMMQAIKANHELLKSGFYCVAVGPPAVAPNTARLRLTLTAVHTSEDIKRLVAIISKYVKFQVPSSSDCSDYISPRL
ncbi:5-aminolevulinate synthase [Hibiscus syriacus]|uniref:5-aminolevulinate synthase n=1 Tax=Hibiscus syriacus TaxID=106335 RepID=A0A6A3BGW9_HIBSY|nr:5-aminolevulinate synthase [Hibiscus syriacus]